jgi:hypothetical protein
MDVRELENGRHAHPRGHRIEGLRHLNRRNKSHVQDLARE